MKILFLRKLHRWAGLLVGLQLLLWTASGTAFAFLDHHRVSAEHSTRTLSLQRFTSGSPLNEPPSWLHAYRGKTIYEIRLTALLDQWVWRVALPERTELRLASTGERLTIDEPLARRIALSRYAGEGTLESITYRPPPHLEARKAGPVWQAQFADAERTALYLSADDGHLVAARTSTWRIFDFFWMLHTMDYRGRDNFNNPLVITAASAALWLALSGMLLIMRTFRRHDFGL